ncbi:hypothetical protein [Rhodopirellula bahusiensis]|uniref:hypothetical protein n=1 Tax=Rhodopirellula bahusiensis TaxID=2014065 RepID=UPI003264022B
MINNQQLQAYRRENTRTIEVGDNQTETLRLPPELWEWLPIIELGDGYGTRELAAFACEEMRLQEFSFEQAFRCVVAFLANQYHSRYGESLSRQYSKVGTVTMTRFNWMKFDAVVEASTESEQSLLDAALQWCRSNPTITVGESLLRIISELYPDSDDTSAHDA